MKFRAKQVPIVEPKEYKKFVRRFEQAADRESMLSAARDWFDVGGGSDETFGDQTVFSRVVEAKDESLIERALNLLSPWSRFRSVLAIGVAIGADNAGLLKKILDAGASPSVGRGQLSNVAKAADRNAFACVDALLENGLSVDDRGGLDLTPLHWVSKTGNVRAAAFLVERGADPQATTTTHGLGEHDKEPITALQMARKNHRTGVVRERHSCRRTSDRG